MTNHIGDGLSEVNAARQVIIQPGRFANGTTIDISELNGITGCEQLELNPQVICIDSSVEPCEIIEPDCCDIPEEVDYVPVQYTKSYLREIEVKPETFALFRLLTLRYSRLFDDACHLEHGFFAPAGEKVTSKFFYGNGSPILYVTPHVRGSVTSVSFNGGTFSLAAWHDRGEYLLYSPCNNVGCGCSQESFCMRNIRGRRLNGWPESCACINARWGFQTIPFDVVEAVLSMALQTIRRGDSAIAASSDITDQNLRFEQTTTAWKIARDHYLAKYHRKTRMSLA